MRARLRIIPLLCLVAGLAAPAHGAKDQLGFSGLAAPTTGTIYAWYGASGSNQNGRAGIVSQTFTAKNIYCEATGSPGAGNNWTVTLLQAAFATPSTWSDTSIATTITDPAIGNSDTVATASVTAGDSLVFRVVCNSATTCASGNRITCTVGGGSGVTLGASNVSAPTGTTTVWGYHSVNGSSTESNFPSPIPRNVTAGQLYCASDNPPGGSATYRVRVRKASAGSENTFSDTALFCDFTSAAVTCQDLAGGHNTAFSAGDQIVYQVTPTGSPGTAAKIRCSLVAT